MVPFDVWARENGMIAVGSSLIIPGKWDDGRLWLLYVDMSVPNVVPPDVTDIEAWLRECWLKARDRELARWEDR